MTISGIYKITNPEKQIYIGQSIDCTKRKYVYFKYSAKGQSKLHNSVLKYGWTNHTFEIIFECHPKYLNEKEKYFIKIFNTYNTPNGLNMTKGGNGKGDKKYDGTRQNINLSIRLHKILTAYAFYYKLTKNDAFVKCIEGFYKDIPKMSERELLDLWEQMTPEQRKYPHK